MEKCWALTNWDVQIVPCNTAEFTLQHVRLIFLLSSPPDNIESHSLSNGLLLIKEMRYHTAYEIGNSISCLFFITKPYINAKLQAYGFHDIFAATMWIPSQVKPIKSFLLIIVLCEECKNSVFHTTQVLAHFVDDYIINNYGMITTYYFHS